MTLRDGAIEAMAEATLAKASLRRAGYKPHMYAQDLEETGAVLDALLVYLTEHTEEWNLAAYADTTPPSYIHGLLAALRGTTEEQ